MNDNSTTTKTPVVRSCLFFSIIIGLLAGVISIVVSLKLMTYPKKSVFFLLDLSESTSNVHASYPTIVGNYIKESKIFYNPVNSGVIYFSTNAKFQEFPANKSSDNARYNQTLVQYIDNPVANVLRAGIEVWLEKDSD